MKNKTKYVSTWQLALMTAAAVISLRGLPMMGKEEFTMFFYILFATVLFLIPAALVGAELGSAFAEKGGGVYTWVKEAFNERFGFVAIFLQWIQNVVWYPTVLSFAAAAIAYLIGKQVLAQDGTYVGIFSIVLYWFATWVTLKGTSAVSKITSRGFLLGTVLPGLIIIIMAIVWMITGQPIAMEHIPATESTLVAAETGHVHPRFFPHITSISNIAFLAGIILLFAGVEVHAVHATEMKNPKKQFPAAIFLAAIIAFVLFTLGSLAISIVMPYKEINLQDGLMLTFQHLFDTFHIGWMTNVLGALVAFGALAGVMSWISGPSRGLLWTARDGQLPKMLTKTNKNGIQINILLVQGIIVTILSSLYFVIDDVSVAFFLLSALTIGLYLIMYMLMYAAAIKLRKSQPDLPRIYKVPGGRFGMWFVAGIGFLAVLFSFVVAFFPPSQLPVGSPAFYVGLVFAGTVVFVSIPFIISNIQKRKKNRNESGLRTIRPLPFPPKMEGNGS